MQLHNLLADCARELSKPSKDLAGLLVRTEKKFLVLGFVFFMGVIVNGVGFCPFWLRLPGPRPSLAKQYIYLCAQ